ncbi:MAG: glycosyltransferase family 2 protein [Nitrospiraceae bacterium]
MQEPTVSVCIPTYNRASMLREAIESVLMQSFEDFELIVSDNASEDETENTVTSYVDNRIQYLRNDQNIGCRENFNRCLALAKGQYIAFLPDDDAMMPDNLAAKVEALSRNHQVGLVHSKYHLIDSDGRIMKSDTNWGHGPDRMSDAVEAGHEVLRTMLLTYNTINLPTVLFRKTCYHRLGGWTDELSLTCDWEYWMRIAAYYDIAFIARPLIKWRIHTESRTSLYAHGASNTVTEPAFREGLLAKHLILRRYSGLIAQGHSLKKQVRLKMRSQIVWRGETLLGGISPNPRVRAFLLLMCRTFPWILVDKRVWKLVLKSVLRRQSIQMLKRLQSFLMRATYSALKGSRD